jgi:hypothetical protein
MGKNYEWTRLWVERGTRKITNDEEQDYDPFWNMRSSDRASYYTMESLEVVPCLVLLGEPGIGKSDELRKAFVSFQTPNPDDVKLLYPDGPVESFREIFSHEIFSEWLHGQHNLYLFVDGLDEEPIGFDEIKKIITSKVKYSSPETINRLFFRVTCRTAAWSETLGETLVEIWGNNSTGIYELSHLRQEDILLAANEEGLDPDAFYEEVERVGVNALAAKPLTLKSLLREFDQTNGQLPSLQLELYERYCKALCEEPNPLRQEVPRFRGQLSPEQRIAVASQIAAILLLTKHNAIWRYSTLEELPESTIAIDELYAGQTDVTREMVEEALATGLFASRGEKRLGWAHQSYAEFLAARYLHQKLGTSQIKNLIFHPHDRKIKPELIEVAAWLASMSDEVLDLILEAEEVVTLFKTSVVVSDKGKRAKITDSLLETLNRGALLDVGFNWKIRNRRYQRLQNPSIAEQLRPYIRDSSKQLLARYVAVDITEVCQLQELEDVLLDVALDQNQPYEIRKESAFAVSRIGTQAAKIKLKPLIYGDPADRNDDLKAAGLFAVYPDQITTIELFSVLTPRKQDNYLGMYSSFLNRVSLEDYSITDLVTALNWVKRYTDDYVSDHRRMDHTMQDVINDVMLRAWENLDHPEVLTAFAEAVVVRLLNHQPIVGRDYDFRRDDSEILQRFRNELLSNYDKRRKVLDAALPALLNTNYGPGWLSSRETPLIRHDDLEWAINKLQTAETEDMQRLLLDLVRTIFDARDYHHMAVMYDAMQDSISLAERFERFFIIHVDSDMAKELRERHELMRRMQDYDEIIEPTSRVIDPQPSDRILQFLEKCEQEDAKLWWHINWWMLFQSDGSQYFEYIADITTLPGWQSADLSIRARIVLAGLKYLEAGDPQVEEWFGTRTIWRPAFAGYRILYFLLQLPEILENIEPSIWKKWASIIVAFPSHILSQEREPHQKLVAKAYANAPEEMIRFLIELIGKRDEEGSEVFLAHELLHKFDDCWNTELSEALYTKLRHDEFYPHSYTEILRQLLSHDHSATIDYALSLVIPVPSDHKDREQAVQIAAHLMTQPKTVHWWTDFWMALQNDVEFARSVVQVVADGFDYVAAIDSRLKESDLVDFYIFVATQYPTNEERDFANGWSSIGRWRDMLLDHLIARGTTETVLGLQSILTVFPELYQAKRGLERVQKQLRRIWEPPKPAEILELVRNRNARIVQSSNQLLEVVREALQNLQKRFDEETPIRFVLWDNPKLADLYICRPKDEEDLSNFVKNQLDANLKTRGVILNREVEIRRGYGGQPGEIPDIYVSASQITDTGAWDTITVIIEVKGSWNSQIKRRMRTQLTERYLTGSSYSHGLYLVGWFNCPLWLQDDRDTRHTNSVTLQDTIETLRGLLENQAKELSQNGLVVEAFVLDISLR